MITVAPLNDKKEISEFFKKAGYDYDENSGCVLASAGKETLGFCLYRLYSKGITVLCITPEDDLPLADGILRATLHVAAERSAMDARYDGKCEVLFDKLGFILDKNEKKLDIDRLFRGCGCKP